MSTRNVLVKVLDVLDALGAPWMLTGSFAGNYYGEPRLTHDADVVIQLTPAGARQLTEALGRDFVVSEAEEAVTRQRQFNVIHIPTSFKVDFWPLRDHPFDQSAFARRRAVPLFGREVPLPAAEDLILQKLRWARETGSEQQQRDVLAILRGQAAALDWSYLLRWADELGLREALEAARRDAAA